MFATIAMKTLLIGPDFWTQLLNRLPINSLSSEFTQVAVSL